MGSKDDIQELFRLAARGEIKLLIEVVPFEDIDATAKRLENGEVAGRIVMTMP